MNVVRETVKCPRCGQVQIGLKVVDGKLMTDQIQLLGFICQCGRVVHWGKRNDKKWSQ